MRTSLLKMALAILVLAGCTSEVLGSIPPSRFQFQTVVPLGDPKAGGWRKIFEDRAQLAAATAADEAARVVLADPTATMMSAILCHNFIEEMNRRLKDEIPGARVSVFQTAGLTPTHWP